MPNKQSQTKKSTVWFHVYEILGNANLSIVTESRSVIAWDLVVAGRELWGVMDVFIIFIVVIVSWVYTYVRFYQVVYFVLYICVIYICVCVYIYTV